MGRGVTCFAGGGTTTIDGVSNDDLQQNRRGGFTLSLDREHAIKLRGKSGVSTR